MRNLIFNCRTSEKRVAMIENNVLTDLYIESSTTESIVANIYKGRVVKVVPGMEAAFVDIGEGKNGFLQLNQLHTYKNLAADKKRHAHISSFIHEGQELIVQVKKDAFAEKGPRLTTMIELSGRFIVYMPYESHIAVSKKLDEEEREKWRAFGKVICQDGEGIIFRTACGGMKEEIVQKEVEFLRKKWKTCIEKQSSQKPPYRLLYHSSLEEQLVQNIMSECPTEIIVDEKNVFQKIKELLHIYHQFFHCKLTFYNERENIFDHYGIEAQLNRFIRPVVELENGAKLIIEHTEALTIIDVNTGKYTGTYNASETILKTNELAAVEIARQLRIRDIGGIILIDFINMNNENDRQKIRNKLIESLKLDRNYTEVFAFTNLGLLEMTRKKERRSLHEKWLSTCPVCKGTGRIFSNEALLFQLERSLWEYKGMDHEAIWVEVPDDLLQEMKEKNSVKLLEEMLRFKIFLTNNRELIDHFTIRHIGSVREIQERINTSFFGSLH